MDKTRVFYAYIFLIFATALWGGNIIAAKTAQPLRPNVRKSDAAKVYPNKLWTSFAQTLNISNQPQFF